MTIYLDVIWLLNFCTDYLLLALTGILLKRKLRKKRLIISSVIASLYVFFIFTPSLAFLYHPVFKLVFSTLIVFLAFGFKRFSYFFQNIAMFYIVAFVIGGGLIAFRFFLQTESQLLDGMATAQFSSYGDPVSWLFVLIGFPVLWLFTRGRLTNLEMRQITYDQIAQVEIQIDNESYRMTGLIDSGNHLTDPLTKAPVMVVDMAFMNLPEEIEQFAENFTAEDSDCDHSWASRLRMIPYRSVGQEHQFMVALRPDFIRILHKEEIYIVKQGLVGLRKQELSSEGDYNCILHPKMLQQAHTSNAS